jgi:5-(carboxyamino)imidazole ribonucleotide synthase
MMLEQDHVTLTPGGCIGILGGGQLGRMLALAAAKLGLSSHIFAPEADSPAFAVSAAFTQAEYTDEAALARFAEAVDVITYEFENVPVETVRFLEALKPVRPGAKALDVAQDRLREKQLARSLGIETAGFMPVASAAALKSAVGSLDTPSVLKTRRFGYDGKGQVSIRKPEEAPAAWEALGGQPIGADAPPLLAILEKFVPFTCEVSVIAARGLDGSFTAYDVTENEHRNHILHRSFIPSRLESKVVEAGLSIAKKLGEALDYVGVFAVEFFVLGAGENAPRVHNSGHWTMDGARTSQFEQHIRAVAGWPLGSTERFGACEMINLIGNDVETWPQLLAEPGACLHLYGKKEAREGRKMGHVNRCKKA